MQVISIKDLAAKMNYDSSKLVIEQVKHQVVREFIEVMLGDREPSDTQSDLDTHEMTARLMSLIYKSGIKRKEIIANYV